MRAAPSNRAALDPFLEEQPIVVAACYVAWNEAGEISDSIRSVKAYVDRFVVVDVAFTANPAPGPAQSTDGQRAVVEAACAGVPLTYIEPGRRLEQHVARDLYLAEVGRGAWLIALDGDEVLVGDHKEVLELFRHPPATAVALRVFSTALLTPGMAPDVTPEVYVTAPVIATAGWQPRLFQRVNGLRHRPAWEGVGWRDDTTPVLGGPRSAAAIIVNRHTAQDWAGYQADYAWETRHRTPPPTEGAYS